MINTNKTSSFVLSLVDIFSEAECRKYLIDLVRGPNCRYCFYPIPERHLKRLYEGKEIHCNICKKKFIPVAGSILSQSKMTNRQILKVLVMIEAGFRTNHIAAVLGISRQTVPRWKKKLKQWMDKNE